MMVKTTARECPDCGAMPGRLHRAGCDVERCAECGHQRLFDFCSPRKHRRLPWTGEWPGNSECREYGFHAKFIDGKGWVTCDPSDPEATEDLNRLAVECRWDAGAKRFVRR